MLSLTPCELKARLDQGEELCLIDIREDNEIAYCPMAGVIHLPMSQLYGWLEDVAQAENEPPAVIICHHGIRSARVCAMLQATGERDVWNLTGGVDRWALEIDKTMPTYSSRHSL